MSALHLAEKMALKVMRVYGQPWHKSFYRFWYLGHKSKTYHRLWWLLGAVSLSPPGRQNYSIGCGSVLGAGRSSPRDRLISIANNKVYHVLHPHQKNTFFWHFTWILNYTVDCPSQHWMRKKILLYRHWNVFLTTEQKKMQLNKQERPQNI